MKTVTNALRNFMLGNRFALNFDGVNDLASRAGATRLQHNGNVTLEAIINPVPGAPTVGDSVIMVMGTANGNCRWRFRYREDNAALLMSNSVGGVNTNASSSPTNSVPRGRPNHVAVRRLGTAIHYFVNGVQVSATTLALTDSTATELRIGGLTTASARFKGIIANPRVWVRALSDEEIKACADGSPQNYLGCQFFCPTLDGTGATATELVNGYNLTLQNSLAWASFDPGKGDQHAFSKADLYDITLSSGTVLRYTSADRDLVFGGNTYVHDGVKMSRGGTKSTIGVSVDDLEVEAVAKETDLVNGLPFLNAARTGALDGASLLLRRVYLVPNSAITVGALTVFSGRIASLKVQKPTAVITVKSDTELLNINLPRRVYQPGCIHTLYDNQCDLIKNNFRAQLTVSSGSTRKAVKTNATQVTGKFSQGVIQFTSGDLTGVRRTVRVYDNTDGEFRVVDPLPSTPQAGDTLDAWFGCNKRQNTCGMRKGSPQFGNDVTFTVNTGTEVVTFSSGAWLEDDLAVFLESTGTLPAPLSSSTRYFLKNVAGATAMLSLTMGGATINITSVGSGTHSVAQRGKFANIDNFRGYPYIPAAETAA